MSVGYGLGSYGSGLYGAGAPSGSPQDANFQKFQVIKVYDPTGVFLGTIDDASYITGIKDTINAASDAIHIILPRAIDAFDGQYQPGSAGTIAMGNTIQIWMYGAGIASSGILRFNGIIDTITPKLDENGGQSVDVLCTPYSQLALGDHAVTTTLNIGTSGTSSTYIDTGVMFSQFFTGSYVDSTGTTQSTIDAITGNPYGAPYTMDPASASATGQKSQFSFQNQTVLSALSNVLLLGPNNYFFRVNPNKTVFFGQIPNSPTYTLLLGQHITSIEFPQDNVPRKNVVVIQGNGTVKGTYTGSSVSSLGQRVYFKADNRITDTNTAQALANGIGALLDQTVIRAKVKIPDYRGDTQSGLGFDIEKFQVGETVKIVDARAPASSATGAGSIWGGFVWGGGKWGAASSGSPTIWGSFNWGQATWGTSLGAIFNTVTPIMAITRSFHFAELELGFKAPSLNKKVFDIEAKMNDATLLG